METTHGNVQLRGEQTLQPWKQLMAGATAGTWHVYYLATILGHFPLKVPPHIGHDSGDRRLQPEPPNSKGIQASCGHTGILQVNRHPTGKQTSYRYTDILQEYRHPTGIQTSWRYTIQTPDRYTDILQVYRHPAGIQTSFRYTDTAPPWNQNSRAND